MLTRPVVHVHRDVRLDYFQEGFLQQRIGQAVVCRTDGIAYRPHLLQLVDFRPVNPMQFDILNET